MQKYQDVIQDVRGNAVASAIVTVYVYGTLTPATIYSDNGLTVIPSSQVTTNNDGQFFFYAANGRYTLSVSATGFAEEQFTDVSLFDPDDQDAVSSSNVEFVQAGTGAVARSAQSKLRDVVSVKDFGAVGDGVANDTAAIQAAIDYAFSLSLGNITVPYDIIRKGATIVYLPAGSYKTTATLTIKEGVCLQGAGRFSTIITSSYNGTIVRNATPVNYDAFGMGIKDLCVQGDRTKLSQIGIALLRDWQGVYENVSVVECGSHGWRLYQCIGSQFSNIESLECVGHGFMVTDGIASWESATPNNLPSNNLSIFDIHTYGCDQAGIYLGRIGSGIGVMGCQFFGGASEYNYKSSSAGTGYNVELVDTASAVPNCFYSLWCEDTNVLAHVHLNLADVAETAIFENFKHFGNGASNYPQKAIIVTKGRLLLNSPVGSGASYRTYLGSNAPFQITKATGTIWGGNFYGSTMNYAQAQVVDETGASSGLENNLKINNYGTTWGGPYNFNTDAGQLGPTFTEIGQAHPYVEMSPFYKGIMFGPGTSAVDAGIYRHSANVVSTMSGDSFRVEGTAGATVVFANGTANGSVATTLGSVGPTGSTAGNPVGWLRINVSGTDRFIPYW